MCVYILLCLFFTYLFYEPVFMCHKFFLGKNVLQVICLKSPDLDKHNWQEIYSWKTWEKPLWSYSGSLILKIPLLSCLSRIRPDYRASGLSRCLSEHSDFPWKAPDFYKKLRTKSRVVLCSERWLSELFNYLWGIMEECIWRNSRKSTCFLHAKWLPNKVFTPFSYNLYFTLAWPL